MSDHATIASIRQANEEAGQHWFSPSTMRFFQSRVLPGVIGGRFFVTSERNGDGPRLYTVRSVDERGHIDTVGDFQAYTSPSQARSAARKAAGL